MITWKKRIDAETGAVVYARIDENGDMWSVPETPGNRHYEEYLEWVAEGNEPEVIEEP